MAKFFGNLHLVLVIGLVAALGIMFGFQDHVPINGNTVARWLHLFSGSSGLVYCTILISCKSPVCQR